MRNFDLDISPEDKNRQEEFISGNLAGDKDLVMEQILENIDTTPIGQVLKKIASLPEVRKEKVLDVRHRLTQGQYELNERLDVALDKVLESIIK